MTDTPRVAVIGLDCGTPQLLFRDFEAETPNIHALMKRGMWGDLASITPPITVPAWACAMTGKTPGQLGIYGFRNRKDTSYEGLSIATSDAIKEPAVWDVLGAAGLRSLLIGVPPSFPPPKGFPGWRVGCFLTPPSAKSWAFPAQLETEMRLIDREFGSDPAAAKDLRETLTDTCLRCHGAMGKRQFEADHPGSKFSTAHVLAAGSDPHARYGALARDGVSCAVCHRTQPRPQPAGH